MKYEQLLMATIAGDSADHVEKHDMKNESSLQCRKLAKEDSCRGTPILSCPLPILISTLPLLNNQTRRNDCFLLSPSPTFLSFPSTPFFHHPAR